MRNARWKWFVECVDFRQFKRLDTVLTPESFQHSDYLAMPYAALDKTIISNKREYPWPTWQPDNRRQVSVETSCFAFRANSMIHRRFRMFQSTGSGELATTRAVLEAIWLGLGAFD